MLRSEAHKRASIAISAPHLSLRLWRTVEPDSGVRIGMPRTALDLFKCLGVTGLEMFDGLPNTGGFEKIGLPGCLNFCGLFKTELQI